MSKVSLPRRVSNICKFIKRYYTLEAHGISLLNAHFFLMVLVLNHYLNVPCELILQIRQMLNVLKPFLKNVFKLLSLKNIPCLFVYDECMKLEHRFCRDLPGIFGSIRWLVLYLTSYHETFQIQLPKVVYPFITLFCS